MFFEMVVFYVSLCSNPRAAKQRSSFKLMCYLEIICYLCVNCLFFRIFPKLWRECWFYLHTHSIGFSFSIAKQRLPTIVSTMPFLAVFLTLRLPSTVENWSLFFVTPFTEWSSLQIRPFSRRKPNIWQNYSIIEALSIFSQFITESTSACL